MQMEDTEVDREGEFVWEIHNFKYERNNFSEDFKFGKYYCYLEIRETDDEDNETTEFKVYLNGRSINDKIFCELSLINGLGEEILVTERNTVKFEDYITLMTISHFDLNSEGAYDPLRDGVFTLRLSWHNKEESNQERGTRTASNLNSEKESGKLLQTLSEDFARFYENKMDTDSLLRVGETLIPVHRAVLSSRSEVFAAMFRKYLSENRSGVVDIPDVNVAVFSDVLYYIYSGQTHGMSADSIVPMYIVANRYALIQLRDACLAFLMRSLTIENVCDAAQLAHTHGETKLEEEVVKFVKEKIEEIEETDKWKELLKSKSSLPIKLLRSALMASKDDVKNVSSK